MYNLAVSHIAIVSYRPGLDPAGTAHNALPSQDISNAEESRPCASPAAFNDDLDDGRRIWYM